MSSKDLSEIFEKVLVICINLKGVLFVFMEGFLIIFEK